MMSSTSARAVGSAAATTAGHPPDAFLLYSSSINGGQGNLLLQQPLITTVWRDPDEPLSRLRRTIASWLAGNPYPSLGLRRAPLSDVVHLVQREPSLSSILHNSPTPHTHLKLMLLGPENHDVFAVRTELEQEVLLMDELALRRAAASASSLGADLEPLHLLSSSWQFSTSPNVGPATVQLSGGSHLLAENSAAVTYSQGSGNLLAATASYMTSSNAALTNYTGSSQLRTALSWGPDDCDAVDAHTNTLSQAVLDAVLAAWPGSSALARLKRRAALALASAKDGPEGPYSMLASALGDVLHRHEAEAVAELRHPVTKTLRVKQLLHEGAPTDALLPHGITQGSALQLGGSSGVGGVGSVAVGAAAAAAIAPCSAPGTEGAGFLRVVK
ncbi:hypothetical protein Vretimale_17646, partial [Volvox reticuliferus]